jgi:TolB-like protein/tetratricopeptide (TPR) repeat protein
MPSEPTERRLAAILNADVAGYSRHMAEDEPATVRTITAYREVISDLVGRHRGRLVDATGDNALAEFPTALDAVECAVETQRLLRTKNASLPPPRRMELRIGVHLGDISIDGGRIYGDGVNIAARLQALADPGGICVSGAVHEQVARKLQLACEDLGERTVKNVPRPLRVLRLLIEAPTAAEASSTSPTPSPPSIVVLSFADMSPLQDQAYFCDGMAEEIINALTRLEGLNVVARTSAFAFKGQALDVREVGSRLGVRSVLEGSVRTAGNRLRVTAQLIDAMTGYHLWSDRFDREHGDVFAIQDEIASSIAATLKVRLGVEPTVPSPAATRSQDAYHHYLRGLHHQGLDTADDWKQAICCFESAIACDPDYAAPHAGIALAYVRLVAWERLPMAEVEARAMAAATTAVELDERLPEAQNALGSVLGQCRWDWSGAERHLRRSIELRPGDALFRHNIGARCLIPLDRLHEAMLEERRALALDPLSLAVNRGLGELLYYARHYDESIAQFRHTLELAPGHVTVRALLAVAYSTHGQPLEAMRERKAIFLSLGREAEARELELAFDRGGDDGVTRWLLGRALARVAASTPDAEPAVLERGPRAWWLALLHARLGAQDEAFRWLEQAVRLKDGAVCNVKVEPWLDGLRSDRRYAQILARMNLT